jgi:predicted nucleic acid-binding protein
MDEQAGRLIAQSYGVKVTGILGVLIQAKDKGLISEVKPLLQRLISDAGFWLNPKLIEEVLKLVGE